MGLWGMDGATGGKPPFTDLQGGRRVILYFVYLIQSVSNPTQWYVGFTEDLDARLQAHNAGDSTHTSKSRPWRYVATVGFDTKMKAVAFERYLKSGSGQAFARRHFR